MAASSCHDSERQLVLICPLMLFARRVCKMVNATTPRQRQIGTKVCQSLPLAPFVLLPPFSPFLFFVFFLFLFPFFSFFPFSHPLESMQIDRTQLEGMRQPWPRTLCISSLRGPFLVPFFSFPFSFFSPPFFSFFPSFPPSLSFIAAITATKTSDVFRPASC